MSKFSNRTIHLTAIASLPAILLTLSIPIAPAAASNQFDVCVSELSNGGVTGDQAATACADALIPKELSRCVLEIRGGTPIEAEKALDACYQVRRPVDLANCVVDIQAQVLTASVTPVATQSTTPSTTGETTNLETTPENEASTPTSTDTTSPDISTENEANTPTSTDTTSPDISTENEASTPTSTDTTSPDISTEDESTPSLQALDSCRRSLLPGRYSECVTGVSRSVQDLTPVQAMETCLDAEDFPRDLFPAYTEN